MATGAIDMIDFPAWSDNPWDEEARNYHAHNRLLASVTATDDERRAVARRIAEKLTLAEGPTVYIVPRRDFEERDRAGQPMHAPDALAAFLDESRRLAVGKAKLIEVDAHINDAAFVETALGVFDAWTHEGLVPAGCVE